MSAPRSKLVPELDVTDLAASLVFYVDLCRFRLLWQRRAETFAYLELGGAELMLQQADGPGRRFRTASLERPFGRGVNLQIEVCAVEELHARLVEAGQRLVVELEDRYYEVDGTDLGNRQFVVADPDGYLLRFFGDRGPRNEGP